MTRLVGFLAFLLLFSKSAMAAPSCSEVVKELVPCLGFLKGDMSGLLGDQPSQTCCSGVKGISNMVKNKGDRTAICQCLKQELSKIGSYNPARIPLLSKKCGASNALPPIDHNTDCSKVVFGGVIHVAT